MKIEHIDIDFIVPNRSQPRTVFDEEKLSELRSSIERNGIIQPILVKREGNIYIIIAGERRWRAAMSLGYSTMPAIVKEIEKNQEMELAIVENLQRENLDIIEEAMSFKKYLDDSNCTQEELGRILGKSRSYIANAIRLLNLPENIINYIREGRISSGHGRLLLSIKDVDRQLYLANKTIEEELSVRKLEKEISLLQKELNHKNKKQDRKFEEKDIFLRDAQDKISESIGLKVNISNSSNRGKLQIEYTSELELEKLMNLLLNKN